MNPDGSDLRQLTRRDEHSFYAEWSPDAKKIVYCSGSPQHYTIHVMNTDGTSDKQLTAADCVSGCPSWWFDGSKLLFHTDRNGKYQIWSMEADGSNQRVAIPFASNGPKCSPRSGEFLFSATREGIWNIWLAKLDSSGSIIDSSKPHSLTTNDFFCGGASWSPEGDYIAFSARQPDGEGIWITNRKGSNQRLIFRDKRKFIATSWAPDGKSIICSASNSLFQGEPTEGDIIVLFLGEAF